MRILVFVDGIILKGLFFNYIDWLEENFNNSKIAVWRVCVAAFRSLFKNAAEMDAKRKDV